MSFNGSGTFVINSAGQPVVANTVISATVFNALTADLATGLTNCITKDGQSTPTANIPMGNNKITGLGAGTAATDAATLGQVQSTAAKLISVTGTDTISGTMSPALTAYAAGQLFYFIANAANTGAMTINIDGLGAKNITRDGSTALVAGDVNSGEIVVICYDGTRFQMINAANSFGNTTINGTLTVTGNTALQANVSVTSALSVGGVFAVTGAATLGSTLAVTGKSDLPTVSTASMNAAVAVVTTGTVTNLTATSASVASMNAGVALLTTATVTTLNATGASIASANIGNLQFTAASIASINAGVAVVTNLTATSASIASMNGSVASITTVNATTVNATNVEVTNVKAKDGTAAITIADSTGAVTVGAGATINGGAVFNETGADVDFRIESDTNANAFVLDGATGNIGIGGTASASQNVSVTADLTGATSPRAFRASGTIQSDATGNSAYFLSQSNTADAAFSVNNISHFYATQGTITGGSRTTPSAQTAFSVDASLTGATNNYGFYSNIASGSGRYNFFANGSADNYFKGNVGIGTTSPGARLTVCPNATVAGEINLKAATGSTVSATVETVRLSPDNATFLAYEATTSNGNVFNVNYAGGAYFKGDVGIGTNSPATALHVNSGTGNTVATFESTDANAELVIKDTNQTSEILVRDAETRITVDALNADAGSYFSVFIDGNEKMRIDSSGNVGIGGTANADTRLHVLGTAPSSSGNSRGVLATQTIPSSTTGNFIGYGSLPSTQASAFTLSTLLHFWASQSTLGAGSTVTNQYGFYVENSLTGATNNYGFYSDIASGSNRWNFYAAGTADNYFAGNIICSGSYIRTSDGTAAQPSLQPGVDVDTGFYRPEANTIGFSTLGTERMRITSGGEVYIAGTTDQGAYNLQCNGTGVWGAGAYVNGSDERLKDDITTLNDGLNVVSQLRPVTFKYKPDYSKDQNIQTGFIAQELQAVLEGKDYADGVVQAGPEYLNVAYQSLIPILVKAVQELKAELDTLKGNV